MHQCSERIQCSLHLLHLASPTSTKALLVGTSAKALLVRALVEVLLGGHVASGLLDLRNDFEFSLHPQHLAVLAEGSLFHPSAPYPPPLAFPPPKETYKSNITGSNLDIVKLLPGSNVAIPKPNVYQPPITVTQNVSR